MIFLGNLSALCVKTKIFKYYNRSHALYNSLTFVVVVVVVGFKYFKIVFDGLVGGGGGVMYHCWFRVALRNGWGPLHLVSPAPLSYTFKHLTPYRYRSVKLWKTPSRFSINLDLEQWLRSSGLCQVTTGWLSYHNTRPLKHVQSAAWVNNPDFVLLSSDRVCFFCQ